MIPRLWSEETVTLRRHVPAPRRRVLRPEAGAHAAAADLGRRRWRAGDAAHRRRSTPTRPTGRSGSTRSCTSRRCSQEHCDRGRARLRLDRAHPRSRLPALRLRGATSTRGSTRPAAGQLWGRGDPEEYVRDNFVGTVDQVAEKVQGFVDAGCSRVRALVPGLPVEREPRALHRRGRAADPGAEAPDVRMTRAGVQMKVDPAAPTLRGASPDRSRLPRTARGRARS